jgi:hypothetical protein
MQNQVIKVTRQSAVKIIFELKDDGTFFGVTAVKRTTGELRNFVCRGGVTKHLRGGSAAYDFNEKGLILVWDSTCEDPKKAYRTIAIEGIKEVRAGGVTYIVID